MVRRAGFTRVWARVALGILVWTMACAPSAPSAPAAPAAPPRPAAAQAPAVGAESKPVAAPGSAEWDRLVAAAKQEGKLSLLSAAGDVYRGVWDLFEKQYGISVEVFAAQSGAKLAPRLEAERSADQYLADVVVHGAPTLYTTFKTRGWLEPLRPALILPDVVDDSKWIGGLSSGFLDHDKNLVYGFVSFVEHTVYVNRDVVPESELSTLDQLWDPKWAGKIALFEPRVPSPGSQAMATWLLSKGEDRVRAFLRDQQPAVSEDRRQLAEWVVRGRYPIGIGVVLSSLTLFKDQGLPIEHVKPLVDPDPAAKQLSYGTTALALIDRAPHPNAAKVFANWLLTREAQDAFAQRTGYNVRRLDVALAAPEQAVDPNEKYLDLTLEDTYHLRTTAMDIAREIIR